MSSVNIDEGKKAADILALSEMLERYKAIKAEMEEKTEGEYVVLEEGELEESEVNARCLETIVCSFEIIIDELTVL